MEAHNQLHPPESKYLNCTRCGLCLSVCPTYREYLSETSSPRGRVALARKALEGDLILTQNLFSQMYACFDCLACNQICPVGIHPADLALDLRQIQEQIQPAIWKKAAFEKILPRPEQIELAAWPLRLFRQMDKLSNSKLGDIAAMLPPIPFKTARKTLPEVTPADKESKYKVGFFLGCAQSLLFPDQSAAAVRVMAYNQCTVITPKETVCCGMPARGYGRQDILLDFARQNIEIFKRADIDVIVTDCATCGSTLKEYGEMLADDPEWADNAAEFSSKVQDISEFLLSIPLAQPEHPIHARVTYHDPCHLRRGQGVWEQPRRLLQMIDDLEFVELQDSDWCCGSAGSQLVTHYQTSLKVLDRKMDCFEATGANLIVSGCPGCQMQLNVGTHKRGLDARVTHPIQMLDQAYFNWEQNHG